MRAPYPQLTYRLGVGMMLLNAENMVFVGRRKDTPGDTWQMPQGGIEEGETPEQAVLRELLEEVGTDNVAVKHCLGRWLYYDIPENMMPRSWSKRKYKGQKQMWFLMRLRGDDDDININTQSPEFSSWKWVPMHWVADNIASFKRDMYKDVVEEFSKFLRDHES